jgi:hypothetical protein
MFVSMKYFITCKLVFIGSISSVFGQVHQKGAANSLNNLSQKEKVVFIQNHGQVLDQQNNVREDVLFSGTMSNVVFHLKNNGISYQFSKPNPSQDITDVIPKNGVAPTAKTALYRLDMNWINVNENASVKALNPQINSISFGGNRINSHQETRVFSEVYYTDIYSNIDLHYYEQEGSLKYDFLVDPFADYRQIIFEISGANEISIQVDGSVLIETPFGSIVEEAPIVYQENKLLESRWKLEGNRLSFELDGYDPRYSCLIDPLVRDWGTFYGGNWWDAPSAVMTDSDNNVLLCGRTNSYSLLSIATSGAHQDSVGGDFDAFIAKFDSDGTRIWGTFFGGPGVEYGNDMAIDPSGNIYLVGSTTNNDNFLLTTPGCHQEIYGGGEYDVILSKFTSSGELIWSTLYGGNGWDAGFSCETDADGNVYITGHTASTNLSTPTGIQQSFDGGFADAYIAKFNGNGTLLWGTYYGGTGYDLSRSCDIDPSGNVYIAGHTSSQGLDIATATGHQSEMGGIADGFIAKFDPAGNRIWGTFYGGAANEDGGYGFHGYACVCDGLGNVYMTGVTESTEANVIATSNGYQQNFGGIQDAFLVKFNASGVRQWGTYYGGSGATRGYSCAIDENQNVYMAGEAVSDDGPAIATSDGFKTTCDASDNFLVQFNPNGQRLWGTFYGGQSYENSGYCAVDNDGGIYLSGSTDMYSGQFQIVTTDAHQILCNEFQDAYLVKFIQSNSSAGLNALNSLDFNIYPNPAKNVLQIANTSNLENVSVECYNLLGEQLFSIDLNLGTSTIDLQPFQNGLYILNFKKDTESIGSYKLIKE